MVKKAVTQDFFLGGGRTPDAEWCKHYKTTFVIIHAKSVYVTTGYASVCMCVQSKSWFDSR